MPPPGIVTSLSPILLKEETRNGVSIDNCSPWILSIKFPRFPLHQTLKERTLSAGNCPLMENSKSTRCILASMRTATILRRSCLRQSGNSLGLQESYTSFGNLLTIGFWQTKREWRDRWTPKQPAPDVIVRTNQSYTPFGIVPWSRIFGTTSLMRRNEVGSTVKVSRIGWNEI